MGIGELDYWINQQGIIPTILIMMLTVQDTEDMAKYCLELYRIMDCGSAPGNEMEGIIKASTASDGR